MKIKKPKQTEKEIQAFVLDYLQRNRIGIFWRNQTTGIFDPVKRCYRKNPGMNGIADILGVMYGRFVAIECKGEGNSKLDPAQEIFKAEIDHNGGHYYLANDVDEFQNWIKALRGILRNC